MTERRRVKLDNRGAPAPDAPAQPADECRCAYLEREDWDGVENDWTDITFVTTGSTAILGVPVGFASAKAGLEKQAAKLGLSVPDDAMLLLGAGKFRRTIMLEVEGSEATSRGVERPGGIAFTRLVPAPWGDMRRVVDETKAQARERYGKDPDDMYVWYLTCRVCSAARNFETLIVAHYKKLPVGEGETR